jgi:formylmethanofuran dehydrogenase subunit E
MTPYTPTPTTQAVSCKRCGRPNSAFYTDPVNTEPLCIDCFNEARGWGK